MCIRKPLPIPDAVRDGHGINNRLFVCWDQYRYPGWSPSPVLVNRPVESHRGARENIIAGPYHPFTPSPHSVCLEIETPKPSRGRKSGERCPFTIRLEGRGSVTSSPSGVAPAESGFYAYFRSERSHLEHHFQYFWATAGPPKRRGARENFPPSHPPSRRACSSNSLSTLTFPFISHEGEALILIFNTRGIRTGLHVLLYM